MDEELIKEEEMVENPPAGELSIEDSKAALGIATRLMQEYLAQNSPQEEEELPQEEVAETEEAEEVEEEPEEDIDEKLDEFKKEIKDLIKKEVSGIREDIKDAINE
jgi:hypothetical protein